MWATFGSDIAATLLQRYGTGWERHLLLSQLQEKNQCDYNLLEKKVFFLVNMYVKEVLFIKE